ncbi:MAG: DUF3047 domain-containing protein [Bdellovibrionales bacterium]|nr:DUF3047 domain-containing protein [Bdellovibrionales bacterium]
MPAVAQKISSLVIPMLLSQWSAHPIFFKGTPKLSESNRQLTIETENAAGGYVYIFPKPVAIEANTRLGWKWAISKFPQKEIRLPLKKSTDDFAVRIGVLLSDGTSRISLPGNLQKALPKSLPLSYVLFYCATPQEDPKMVCEVSPYHKNFVNCMKKASQNKESIAELPLRDLASAKNLGKKPNLKAVGLWLFADSDNLKTRSEAQVSDLVLSNN